MKRLSLNESITTLTWLRFLLSMMNFIMINYYAANKYIRKFSHDDKTYVSIFENPLKFDDIYKFYGARYEDTLYQSQYLINPKKYRNYYLIDDSKIEGVWDIRNLNHLSLAGYVRHPIEQNITYSLLELNSEEKNAVNWMFQDEFQEECSLPEKNSVINYIMSVSESRNYQIYFWVLLAKGVLVPYPQQKKYKICSALSKNTHWRFDFMLSNKTQFELIEMIGFKQGIPEDAIHPFVDTLSYFRLITYINLEFCLNLPLVIFFFMFSVLTSYLCMYTSDLAFQSQKTFRDRTLNLMLCFFIWNVYEFQHNFDANILFVSRELSSQQYANSFCTLPLFLDTHFFLRTTQLAFGATFLFFFFSIIPAAVIFKETFLEKFFIAVATLLIFSGVQFYTIANQFEKSCGYDFYHALYYIVISNFFISSDQSLKSSLFNGAVLKIAGEFVSMIQVLSNVFNVNSSTLLQKLFAIIPSNKNYFSFFKKENFEQVISEHHDCITQNNQENTNETLIM